MMMILVRGVGDGGGEDGGVVTGVVGVVGVLNPTGERQ